jgi:hypothetical protein
MKGYKTRSSLREVPTYTGHNTIMNIISCQYKSGIVKFIFFEKEIERFLERVLWVECFSLTLPIFNERFLLSPGFFPEKRRNTYAVTLMIADC